MQRLNAEMERSYWLKLVMSFAASNQSALFQYYGYFHFDEMICFVNLILGEPPGHFNFAKRKI